MSYFESTFRAILMGMGLCTTIFFQPNAVARQPSDPLCGGLIPKMHLPALQDYYNIKDQHYLDLVEQGHGSKIEAAMVSREWHRAFGEISYVLNKVPNHPRALYALIRLNGRYAKANAMLIESKLNCAVHWNPAEPSTYVLYGLYFHRDREFSSAVEQYNIALDLDPVNAQAHYNLGLTLFELADYQGSAEQARLAKKYGYPLTGLEKKLDRISN